MNDWVRQLHDELARMGYCLPYVSEVRLLENPPQSIDAYTDAVLRAEGFDPNTASRKVWRDVRACVARYFRLSIPAAIAQDIGPLLDELFAIGVTIPALRFDAEHFGNYYVDLDARGAALRIVRDRGQYLLEAPIERLKSLGLFRAIDSREELREAVLTYLQAIDAANTPTSA